LLEEGKALDAGAAEAGVAEAISDPISRKRTMTIT
jgi:hypothetical protein